MNMQRQMEQELLLWMSVFGLERDSLQQAFEQYKHLLDELEGRGLSDGEVATSLAQLRKNVARNLSDEAAAPELASQLDDITARLHRSLLNARILSEGELIDAALINLPSRLEAAHTMFSTLRAAVARRTR
jgi:hypothetical protein